MKKFLIIFFACLLNLTACFANVESDMRGVWVASVYNLDYPSKATTDATVLKAEAVQILDNIQDMGLNAVFLQVRPSADALYASDIFPWSKYLTGTNGVSPKSNFDPLKYWVTEAHKRGIEVHAWINPYRITKNGDIEYNEISSLSPAKVYSEYVVKYSDGNYYFNPGEPKVRELVVDGALEIVKKYDVDGIHMDDYFYPGINFNDFNSYSKYGTSFSNIDDWRRNNVDLLINELNTKLHEADKDISFGISPAGIWANRSKNSLGSNTNGLESYSSHYADTRKWTAENMIDYIAPQIYWNIGQNGSDYEILLKWWSDVAKNSKTKLYIGMADYRTVDAKKDSAWYQGKEIDKQLKMNEKDTGVSGEIHYRYSSLISEKTLYSLLKSKYTDSSIKVFANGHKVVFDQVPVIQNSRTLVPIRTIFEALGASVEWDGTTKTVMAEKGGTKVELKIGEKSIKVNGVSKALDVAGQIINSRTLVPLRAVSEAFKSNVDWYPDSKTIIIE